MTPTANDRPIFIVGCPRSGTTLLQLMLHAHPRIAIPPETRFLVPAYRERARFGDLTTADGRRSLAEFITRRRTFRDLGIPRRETIAQIVAGPPTVGSALAIVLSAYARRFDKPRWGDKRPGHFQDIDVLLKLFPDAQIVHLVRDGRDCVASLKRMPWFDEDSIAAMVLWVRAIDACERFGRKLGSRSYFQLRYEDLVTDPEPPLRELCAYLGEEFDPAMTQPASVAGNAVPQRKTWHHRTGKAVDPSAVGHGSGLEPWERNLMDAVAGRRLRALGYPVEGATAPARADLARYAHTLAVKRSMVAKHHLEDRLRDLRLRDDVASRLTTGQRQLHPKS